MTSPFVEVADRVLHARYPQWDVGVGLVLGRDGAVVIDTRASGVQGGEVVTDVRRACPGVRITHVVNTHVHFDHTFGNIAFAGATVHAHEAVARSLTAEAERVRAEIRSDPNPAPEHGYTTDDLDAVLATTLRHPDCAFATSATIDLGDRAVTLTWSGRGHTDGDLAVRVADADVVFLGDLVEESAAPSFGPDSWPLDWAETLDGHLAWIDPGTTVVPGHGAAVDGRFVARQRGEIAGVAAVIKQRYAAGVPLDAARRERDARLAYPLESLGHAFTRAWRALDAAALTDSASSPGARAAEKPAGRSPSG